MPVTATSWLRPLRGGSQTHLLKASDGHHYVVKLSSNPQGLRTLVNEWIAQRILAYLKIPCPEIEIIEIPLALIESTPALGITRNKIVYPPPAGWHFGSRFPVDPNLLAVHDILPDLQLLTVRNLHHFAAALAFDKWTANADSRQCVFYRARLLDVLGDEEAGEAPEYAMRGLVASMIDHGYCFNGIYWDFPDAPGFGLYHRSEVYRKVRGWSDFEPWIERIKTFPETVLDRAIHEIPRAWLDSTSEDEVSALVEKIQKRRGKVASLIESTRERFPDHFPNWR